MGYQLANTDYMPVSAYRQKVQREDSKIVQQLGVAAINRMNVQLRSDMEQQERNLIDGRHIVDPGYVR